MTPLQWFLLCVLFTLYLLFGGSVFMYFEQHREIEKKEEISVLRKDIKEILFLLDRDFYHNDTNKELLHALTSAKIGVINRISKACDAGDLLPDSLSTDPDKTENELPTLEAPPLDPHADKLKWNFYNSVFFAFTVITTIGYGHLSPSTSYSKCFVMAYALIGIPVNSILLSGLGDYFSSRLVKVHKKSKEKPDRKCTFVLQILFYLLPGIVVFIIIPAAIFVFLEGWTFLDAIYYAFVSLTTIGFGDYVAGMEGDPSVWMWVYKAFIIIWITFGLGYLIMILGFISKGMTHKKIRVVIERRLNTIRVTKEKLSRDIDYMRRVVNELYLMKIKPVYDLDDDLDLEKNISFRRHSQPCLFEKRFSSLPGLPLNPYVHSANRRKSLHDTAFFRNLGDAQHNNKWGDMRVSSNLVRRSSDSDLTRIDRDKTFENALRHQVTVDELLVSVVNALSGNVIHDVMEAVEELNEVEDEILTEEDPSHIPRRPSLVPHDYERHSHGHETLSQDVYSHSHGHTHSHNFEDLPPWDLGALSESDEEVLIDDDDSLQQVVVHNQGGKQKSASNLLEKMSEAIRKISTGSRTSSDGPSRKVSRNDSFRRRNELSERKISGSGSYKPIARAYLNPQAYVNNIHPPQYERNQEPRRKISQESRISNISMKSRQTTSSNASSRKVSPMGCPSDDPSRSRISLESTSLAEFLHALDNVHSKLHSQKTSVNSIGDASHLSDDLLGQGAVGAPFGLPKFRRSGRSRHSVGSIESEREARQTHPRRRKNGIIHSNFAFANNAFVADSILGISEKDANKPKRNKDDDEDRAQL